METKKEVYESPIIETVEVKVEQGFQMSSPSSPSSPNTGKGDYTW